MAKGKIGVTTDNIFPIIKKFLYSDHEIFLREIIANAVDATKKMQALTGAGEYKGELGDQTIKISLDTEAKTITVSDRGLGMTQEEVEKYINQIAFSSAGEFLDKYKDKIDSIIGHFGLGFYSSFMVSERVDLITKSYKEGAKAVKWSCDGSPEYTLDEVEKESFGTDIVLHIDKESEEFLEKSKIEGLLKKYCKFLPVQISFGKEQEWKDGKYVDTEKDNIINNTKPAWTKKPSELTDEDYKNFYNELYPASQEPMFNIHLNVDYPFNLTGILYFPRIKKNIEIQKNKIQLYCNQVFVTDSVEGIVPDFLTLLHGVIDSPDIPLNVSRSYLQSDSNVKKISNHITKKVSDRLHEIFKNDREQYEKKWDDLKLFIQYGIITEEKFWERAEKFTLLKNVDGKYFTFEEYQKLVADNQTDKHKTTNYLYTTNQEEQYTFIEAAKSKGYDVLVMDGQLDVHFISNVEQKLKDCKFKRIDSEIAEKLIEKDEKLESKLTKEQEKDLVPVFEAQVPEKDRFFVQFEAMRENDVPVLILQQEFMRRMKDMSAMGGGYSFYGDMPTTYSLVVNSNHPLVDKILKDKDAKVGKAVSEMASKIAQIEAEKKTIEEKTKDKKEKEIEQADKDKKEELQDKLRQAEDEKDIILTNYGKENKIVKQVIDLALLANGLLKGEALTRFVKRSVELIEE